MFFYHGKRAKTAGRAGTAHGRANGHTRRQSGKNGHTRAKKGIQYIVVYERSKHTIYSGMKGKKGRTAGRAKGKGQEGKAARRPRHATARRTAGTHAGRAAGRQERRHGHGTPHTRAARQEGRTGGTCHGTGTPPRNAAANVTKRANVTRAAHFPLFRTAHGATGGKLVLFPAMTISASFPSVPSDQIRQATA